MTTNKEYGYPDLAEWPEPQFPYAKCSCCREEFLAFTLTNGECDSCHEAGGWTAMRDLLPDAR